MVANEVPLLVRFDGGPTDDGKAVIIKGRLANKDRVLFRVECENISWIIAKLAEWTREAALRAGWTSRQIAQQDHTEIWMRPTQYGMLEADEPGNVHLAIDVGPIRFRFQMTRYRASELGRVLQAASAPSGRSN